jgi:hypothetical protein
MASKFGAVAAVIGFLYLLYQRFMGVYYTNSVDTDESKELQVDTNIAKQEGKLETDKKKYEDDSKLFDPDNK